MKQQLIVALLFAFFVCTFAGALDDGIPTKEEMELLNKILPKNITGTKYCPTEDIWKWKKMLMNGGPEKPSATCVGEGICDNPSVRDSFSQKKVEVDLYITVLCDLTGKCPSGISQQTVETQIQEIDKDFKKTGIVFKQAKINFYKSSQWQLSEYGQSNQWYYDLMDVKNTYSVSADKYLNVFITAQKSGRSGTLLGIGTFPWDNTAKQKTGGLWLNAAYVGYGHKTASHEIGHCVGLWHTFHGDSEVACSSPCYETVHTVTESATAASNLNGDFCSDTAAQPMNYYCSAPTGTDCKGGAWTAKATTSELTNNIMAYTPDNCMYNLTPQQANRGRCWICDALRSWTKTGNC